MAMLAAGLLGLVLVALVIDCYLTYLRPDTMPTEWGRLPEPRDDGVAQPGLGGDGPPFARCPICDQPMQEAWHG